MSETVRIESPIGEITLASEEENGLTYQLVRIDDTTLERIARRIVELLEEQSDGV